VGQRWLKSSLPAGQTGTDQPGGHVLSAGSLYPAGGELAEPLHHQLVQDWVPELALLCMGDGPGRVDRPDVPEGLREVADHFAAAWVVPFGSRPTSLMAERIFYGTGVNGTTLIVTRTSGAGR
jgi:hypothetical protein